MWVYTRVMMIMIVCTLTTYAQINQNIDRLFTIVPEKQELIINGNIHTIDMRRLLQMTAMVESRYGTNKYTGRVAKSPMQYEPSTAEYYTDLQPELTKYITEELDAPLFESHELTGVYVTYVTYMSKIQYHKRWLEKYYKYYRNTGDTEWLIYKVLWNSIKGKSTYQKWKSREKEMIIYQLDRTDIPSFFSVLINSHKIRVLRPLLSPKNPYT